MILLPIITICVFLMFREERKLTKKGKQIIRIERIKRLPTIQEYKVIAENVARLANRINQ